MTITELTAHIGAAQNKAIGDFGLLKAKNMNKNENSSEINPDGALNEVFNSDAGSEKVSANQNRAWTHHGRTHTSILSGGKTRELFGQLNKSNPTKAADAASNYAGVTFQLRYSYTRETYGRENFASKVKYIPTGGMLLTYRIQNIPSGYSALSTGKIRIKPDTDDCQQKAVSRAITRIIRMAANERTRVWHVEQLDKLVKPLESDSKFLKFVERWEKKDGKTSDYRSLSAEDCETWMCRIKHYGTGVIL